MLITDLVFIDDTGYHYSDYPSFLSWLQDSYRGIYGADVYLEADSQDGQFLAILAKAFYDTAVLGASTYNSFSPSTAQGLGLSRVVKINGVKRQVPSFSTVTVTITGQADTVITNGIAQDVLNQKWLLPATVTIPGGGTIDVTATAENVGFVTADASTITTIFTPTLGWQTVTNASAATPGAPVETDAELRVRQTQSVADPSQTIFEATVGGVENVTGVTKVTGYENDTTSTDANGVPANSICLVAAGGTDLAIAEEIELRKTPGTGTYGTTTVTITTPAQTIDINFQRAVTATIHVAVAITSGIGWSDDFQPLIQAAIAAAVNAGRIGDDVLLTKLFSPAYLNGAAAGQTYDVTAITLAKNGGMAAASNVDMDFDENPVCDPSTDVVLTVT